MPSFWKNPLPDPNPLKPLRDVPPRDPQAAARGRARFLAEAEALRPVSMPWTARLRQWLTFPLEVLMLRKLSVLLPVLVMLLVFTGTAAARGALPGSPLYGVKVASESLGNAMHFGAYNRADYQLRLAQRRLDEIQALLAQGKTEALPQAVARLTEHLAVAARLSSELQAQNDPGATLLARSLDQMLAQSRTTLQTALNVVGGNAQQSVRQAIELTRNPAHLAAVARNGNASGALQAPYPPPASPTPTSLPPYPPPVSPTPTPLPPTPTVLPTNTPLPTATAPVTLTATVVPTATLPPDGTPEPTEEPHQDEVHLEGTVESISATAWVIDGTTVFLTADTEIKGAIQLGDRVKVTAYRQADGSLLAREIEPAHDEHESTPTPEPTSTDDEHDITATPAPTGTVEPTATPAPTETPEPEEVEFSGVVDSLSANVWVVGGVTLYITTDTEIKGDIQVGDRVKVKAWLMPDGSLVARKVERDD